MRSFAVIAGFAAYANAAAYGYPAYNTTSVAPPTYKTSEAPAYAVSSSAAAYPVYSVSSSAAEYPSYTTTKVVKGLTTVCAEPTTLTYGSKTYTVKSSTTLIDDDCEYTTTYAVKPTPSAVKPTASAIKSTYTPPVYVTKPSAVPYPSSNATAIYPTGVKPSSTKPTTPEFTGAAAQAGVGLMAVAGMMAAYAL